MSASRCLSAALVSIALVLWQLPSAQAAISVNIHVSGDAFGFVHEAKAKKAKKKAMKKGKKRRGKRARSKGNGDETGVGGTEYRGSKRTRAKK